MARGDTYRTKAAQLLTQAKAEASDNIRRNLLGLSQAYLRLAHQADQNAQLDLSYETPPPQRPSEHEPQA
jgi:hypothetical protein